MNSKVLNLASPPTASALQPSSGPALLIASVPTNTVLARVGAEVVGSKVLRNDDFYDALSGPLASRYRVLGVKNAGAPVNNTVGSFPMGTKLFAQPFVLPRGGSIDRFSIEVTGTAGAAMKMGIYTCVSDEDLYPDALVTGSDGEWDCNTGGLKHFDPASDVVIDPGRPYWVVYQNSGGTMNISAMPDPEYCQIFGGLDGTTPQTVGAMIGLTVAASWAAMPATYPSGATILSLNSARMFLAVNARMSA